MEKLISKDGEKMILVFCIISVLLGIIVFLFLLLISKIEINVKNMYLNNINKTKNNEYLKVKLSLKIGAINWLWITLDKAKIERLYLSIKKKEIKSNINVKIMQKKINETILKVIKDKENRKTLSDIKINLKYLNLSIRISTNEYPITAYLTTFISIIIANILPHIVYNGSNIGNINKDKNIYYKVEPVYILKNDYDILASFIININIKQIIFALVRIKKETNGNNITKKKEGKNYGTASNRKFNEHSYE